MKNSFIIDAMKNIGLIRAAVEGAVIVLLAAAVGVSRNAFWKKGIPWVGKWDVKEGVVSAGGVHDPTAGNVEVSLDEAYGLFEGGEALFVDARSEEDFREGRIPRAVSFPFGEAEGRLEDFMDRHLDPGTLVTYCSGYDCEDSHLLATELKRAGYKDVRVFAGGMPEWEAAGYEVETSEEEKAADL